MSKNFAKAAIIAALGILYSCESGALSRDINTDENAARMRAFVTGISSYAKKIDPGFIIIPQNGTELAFIDTDPDEALIPSYIRAIDGVGAEALFYSGKLKTDSERLKMLRKLRNNSEKPLAVLVSDYVSNDANISDSIERSKNENFIAFPRSGKNYHYELIPSKITEITDENLDDIDTLSGAKNYLYLISTDTDKFPDKEAMLNDLKETNYDVLLIDLFFNGTALTQAEIESLKTKKNGKRRLVISYLNIGSAEMYRYYWKPEWRKGNPPWIRKEYSGYDDEFWVEYWRPEWQNIIFGNNTSYLKKIINAGFDGAYLDNVEAYYFLEH